MPMDKLILEAGLEKNSTEGVPKYNNATNWVAILNKAYFDYAAIIFFLLGLQAVLCMSLPTLRFLVSMPLGYKVVKTRAHLGCMAFIDLSSWAQAPLDFGE